MVGNMQIGLALTCAALLGRIDAAGAVGVGGTCAVLPGRGCDAGLVCDYAPGTCNMLGGVGACVQIPVSCPRRQKPDAAGQVCGCNGTTYPNDCVRIEAKARKAHDGPCK